MDTVNVSHLQSPPPQPRIAQVPSPLSRSAGGHRLRGGEGWIPAGSPLTLKFLFSFFVRRRIIDVGTPRFANLADRRICSPLSALIYSTGFFCPCGPTCGLFVDFWPLWIVARYLPLWENDLLIFCLHVASLESWHLSFYSPISQIWLIDALITF